MDKSGILQKDGASYVRNFIFGVEDSLVSTVGLLSGIAIANVPRPTIFLTGVVLIFVEAFSMAVGSFLSEYSAEEYARRAVIPMRRSVLGGIIMFFAYFISGFIPLLPYVLAQNTPIAFRVSIALSLAALFTLGFIGGKITRVRLWRSAFRMAIIGGIAIAVGILAGTIFDGIK